MGLPLLIGFESPSYRTSLAIIIGINFKRLVCYGYFGEISLNRECHETHAYSSGSGGFGIFR